MFKITEGERLVIERRRAGRSQVAEAKARGVSRNAYVDLEKSKLAPRSKIALNPYELCFLYRLRAGKTQDEVARELKVSRIWLGKMERGEVPCDTLIWYWEQ